MHKRDIGILMAGVIGFLILATIWSFGLSSDSLWAMISYGLIGSSLSAFLATYLAPFVIDRIHRFWNLKDIEAAPALLAKRLPKNLQIEEILICAYTSKIAFNILRPFADRHCKVQKVRFLLRDPRRMLEDVNKEGAIPSNREFVKRRLVEMQDHLLEDVLPKRHGIEIAGTLSLRFYPGSPFIRAVVVDGKAGFFSIYGEKRPHQQGPDFAAANSSVLLLSKDGGYKEAILRDILRWFDLTWKYGSVEISKEDLEKILERRDDIPGDKPPKTNSED